MITEDTTMPQPSTTAPAPRWLHNPVTGELARVNVEAAQTGGRRVDCDLWLQPGAAVAGAHVHPSLTERFTVREGVVGFQLAGVERRVRAGEAPVEIAPGVVHDWWNAGDGLAQVRVEVEADPGVAGAPVARFTEVIEVLWGLGALGRVNAKGMPDPLWLAAIAHEYRDVIRFTRPPALVQRLLFGPLAALARRRGRDVHSPELRGPTLACEIPPPSPEHLAALLARRVSGRAVAS